MRSILETINNVNEASQIRYRVAFTGTRDEGEMPYTVEILVDREYQKDFERYLEDEQDNSIMHAEGGKIEY